MARKSKETRVSYRKLGREVAVGIAHHDSNKVEIDERIGGYRHINILLHEYLHIIHPDWSETKVNKEAGLIARFLWKNNIRWVDLAKR